uniref:Uncharacterized protein n=1 Tax=Arundo donax TaxID=35708 RepID=A0A0A9CNT6_ARUDO
MRIIHLSCSICFRMQNSITLYASLIRTPVPHFVIVK